MSGDFIMNRTVIVMEQVPYGVIYLIVNKVNGKLYFGQTVHTFDKRYSGNIVNTHNKHLKNSIDKHGVKNFKIIKEFDVAYSKEELDHLEDMYIKLYETTNPDYGYNKKYGGANGKASEETKKKISQVTRGENNGMYGKKHTEESKKKMSENSKGKLCGEDSPHWGKPKSEETKKKISETRKEKGLSKGKNNGMYGKTHTEEVRKKIVESNKRRCGENSAVAKKVKCLNTQEVFISATQAAKHFGFKCYESIAKVCRGERKTVKHPITKEPLVFIYIGE